MIYLHRTGLLVGTEPDSGGFVSYVVELPGCVSQGDTEREALANLDDAIACVLEILAEDDPERLAALFDTVSVTGWPAL